MSLLEFAFSGFWTFCGVLLLIGATGEAVAAIVGAWRGRK